MLLQQPSPGKQVSKMGTVLSSLLKKHGSLPNGPQTPPFVYNLAVVLKKQRQMGTYAQQDSISCFC